MKHLLEQVKGLAVSLCGQWAEPGDAVAITRAQDPEENVCTACYAVQQQRLAVGVKKRAKR